MAQLQSDIVQVAHDGINQCQSRGTPSALAEIDLLWQKKRALLMKLESLRT